MFYNESVRGRTFPKKKSEGAVMMKKYTFSGAVRDSFSRILCRAWQGATYAQSKEKAMSNLTYQFKKSAGLAAYSRVVLEGSLSVG